MWIYFISSGRNLDLYRSRIWRRRKKTVEKLIESQRFDKMQFSSGKICNQLIPHRVQFSTLCSNVVWPDVSQSAQSLTLGIQFVENILSRVHHILLRLQLFIRIWRTENEILHPNQMVMFAKKRIAFSTHYCYKNLT